MTLTEAIELLESCTGLTFTRNEYNGQIESEIGDWRISISNFTDELSASPNEAKILCATLIYRGCETGQKVGWKTGQQFVTYSVRDGLLSLSDWLIGFQSAMGFETE